MYICIFVQVASGSFFFLCFAATMWMGDVRGVGCVSMTVSALYTLYVRRWWYSHSSPARNPSIPRYHGHLCMPSRPSPSPCPNSPESHLFPRASQTVYTTLHRTTSCPLPHEFSSISLHFSRIKSFLLCPRFRACVFHRSALRHLDTSSLAPLHMPMAFHMNPRAWHSSRAVMTCSQPGVCWCLC